ncbi:decarboxylating 6-phosphogluconate dehydrogenase [Candidatus Daviesbacteria bacterium]|nr:decarboxylating 6-phosphogluconate dehydrogenase [Candidatus Daviesbacteria bacterium]
MKIGYIGLGKMGKNMVLNLLEKGIEVVAWNRSPEPREEVRTGGAETVETIEEVASKLETPRIVWLMLPAGETTDEFIDKILPLLKPGDLLIDGANSFYKDTLRRAEKIKAAGIRFMDIGVSGGPKGARTGACLMIGGDDEDVKEIKELILAASAPDAWGHFGKIGAGHFAKMVHNGVEYGMMEAIAEGAAILKASNFDFNLADVFRVYNNKSVIESRLVGWTQEALEEDPELAEYSSKINHTGEGEWTIKTAKEFGVNAEVIEESFEVRVESEEVDENSPNGFRNKSVSAMRGKFGGHSVKKS